MDSIKEYLLSVISAVVVGTIADVIVTSLNGKHPGIEKTVRLGFSICILAIMIIPISHISFDFEDHGITYSDAKENEMQDSCYILEREAEKETSEYIFKEIGIKPASVRIDIIINDSNTAEISAAQITVEKKYAKYDRSIKKVGFECLGREVSVVYAD